MTGFPIRLVFAALVGVAMLASAAHADPAPADSITTAPLEASTPAPAPASAAPAAPMALPDPDVRRWQLGFVRADRVQHASLSLTIGLAAGFLSRSPLVAASVSLGLGLAKELMDIGGSGFDSLDLAADAVGAGVAAAATEGLEN